MSYPGGKNGSGVYQQIINQIPPHQTYIEPFLGSGAIMRLKKPAACSIGIDIDPVVLAAFSGTITPKVRLLQVNAIDWLSRQSFRSDTFVYCDPPYLFYTRSQPVRIYKNELSDNDHLELLRIIKTLSCMVMISGYPNDCYDDELKAWRTTTFKTTNRGGGHVTEKLWMNYPEPLFLHDYRYLGNTFRERERIKRKRARWLARLNKMSIQERHALAGALAQIIEDGQHLPF